MFKSTQEVGRNTRLRLVFPPILLSCSSRFLSALKQDIAQSRLLYLLNNPQNIVLETNARTINGSVSCWGALWLKSIKWKGHYQNRHSIQKIRSELQKKKKKDYAPTSALNKSSLDFWCRHSFKSTLEKEYFPRL